MRLMHNNDSLIFLDGKWLSWQDANIHVLTHAFHYATSAYEGTRAYQTEHGVNIFRLADHTKRFIESAKIIRINLPYSSNELIDIQKQLVAKNGFGDSYIRPLAFQDGDGFLGFKRSILKPRLMIANFSWCPLHSKEQLEQGVSAITSSMQQFHPNTMLCKAKAGAKYLVAMLAKDDAERCGADDAIMLDTQGFVSECTTSNIFMLRDNVLTTPPAITALDGITKRSIITLANDLGIKTEERQFTRDELYIADEVFKTGTACEIVPIVTIDDRTVGSGTPGNIYQQLKKTYTKCTHGQLANYQHWNTLLSDATIKETNNDTLATTTH